jgi:hypothetical protein
MGFGWFLVGYFFVSVVSIYSPLSFAMLAGYPMMIYGLWQLAPYHRYLRVSFFSSFLCIPFALYYACYGFGEMGFAMPAVDAVFATVEWIYFVFTLLFTALWLFAFFSLCKELYHQRLLACSIRSMIFFALAQLCDFTARLPIGFVQANSGYFALPAILLRLISIFLNLYLVYLCYRYICPQGEEFSHLRAESYFKKAKDTLKEEKK